MMDKYYETLSKMIAPKQLMNSYKLFMVKAVFSLCNERRVHSDFFEIGCRMVAYSWQYVLKKGERLRNFDKLYDVVVLSIGTEGLFETDSSPIIIDKLMGTENLILRRAITSLTNYVPYRLLTYDVDYYLKGKTDSQKNKELESISKSMDSIYSIDNKTIYIQKDWYCFINSNYQELENWIDDHIHAFVGQHD